MTMGSAPVWSIIDAWARANPRAVAVVDDGGACDRSTLAAWAAAIEMQLLDAGVRRGEAVGVCMQRGAAWIASMLAVLRAGMVYVPLHPGLPAARRNEMCAIADVRVVLAAAPSGEEACDVLAPVHAPMDAASAAAAIAPHPQSPAYLIFTSGTSGQPKAVAITHANLSAHAQAAIARFALVPQDRVLQTCAIGFDISIEETIATLCAGATVVVAPDHVGQCEGGLGGVLEAASITVANLPTALWSAWVDELSATAAMPRSLRCVIVGGEACPVAKLRAWLALEAASRVACINAYGPTETTITTTAWTLRALPAEQLHAPIGRALPNVHTYVLDETLLPADSGELYLGGALVGDGYRNQPAATAAVFLPDPFAARPGARMYRSGDCVHVDADGELVLSARLDRQIKLRGHRIEPAEIERRLEACGGMSAAVVALASSGEGRALVAYLVTHAPVAAPQFRTADASAVSRYADAVATLPDYMRPRWYCMLDALPLNSNGKTDLRALPALPERESVTSDDVFLGAVGQCLGHVPSDLSHSFHAAGGDSIQAVQLLSLLRQRGWILDATALAALPLRDAAALLRPATAPPAPTADDCVGVHLDAGERERLRAGTPRWDEVERIWAASQVQLGMVYRSLTGTREGQYIEQVEGIVEDLDPAAFQAAWRSTIAQHPILRASFALVLRDKPLLLIRRAVEPDWQIVAWPDDGTSAASRIDTLLAADRARGFDLLSPPLMRFRLSQLGPRRHHFLWTYHHALLDGWSDVAVLDAVFAHYDALRAQSAAPVTAEASFADYLAWLQLQDRSAARRYWQAHLDGLAAGRRWLLADTARSPSGSNLRREHRIDATRVAALAAVARSAGATINTLLLAAWARAVAQLRGGSEVVLGTVVATRPTVLSDRIIGPLLNVVPLRLCLPVDGAVSAAWLAALQRVQADRQPHLHVGLDQIGAPDAAPLFDTLFVFENYPPPRHPAAAALRSHTQTEYPLSLLVWPDAELRIELLHDPALIDASLLDRLLSAFDTALEAVLSPALSDDARTDAEEPCMELVI